MSSETSAWAKEQRCGDPVTKAVLMEIANWAKPTGVCEFLSVKRIAEVVEVSTRTVQRHLDRLEEIDVAAGGLGMIRRINRHRDDGGQGANCFELIGFEPPLILTGAAGPVKPKTPPRQSVTPPCQFDREGGDNGVTRLGDKILPLSSPDGEDAPPADFEAGFDEGLGAFGDDAANDAGPAAGYAVKPARPSPAVFDPEKPHRLPDDWEAPAIEALSAAAAALARQWPVGAYPLVCENFRLHWQHVNPKKRTAKGWAASLSNWVKADHSKIMGDARHGVSFAAIGAVGGGEAGAGSPVEPVAAQREEDHRSAAIRERLRVQMGDRQYLHWLSAAALIVTARGGLRIVHSSAFMANWVESHLGEAIAAHGRAVIGAAFGGVKFETEQRVREAA